MSDDQNSQTYAASLQLLLDGLATQVVLEGLGDSVATALKQLSQAAQTGGFLETATEALCLAQLCGAEGDTDPQVQSKMQKGLERLANVLNAEANEVTPPSNANSAQSGTSSINALAADPELVTEFITESREHLTSIEAQMLVLEQNPEAKDAIHAVFRGFHTIKGLAGFLEFAPIQEVAHNVETLLDLARNGNAEVTAQLVDIVLESTDFLKSAIDNVEASLSGQPQRPQADRLDLIERVKDVTNGTAAPDLNGEKIRTQPETQMDEPTLKLENSSPTIAQQSLNPVTTTDTAPANNKKPTSETKINAPVKPQASEGENSRQGEAFTIRIETNKLDRLMDAVGELMVAQSTIRHTLERAADKNSEVTSALTRLSRITADVQRSAMSMRMVPVGQLFGRSARLVRDLSRKLGKQVRYEPSGESTEVDKTIAEELSDPLLHMVRNAVDHGIEMPEVRKAAGKNPVACVRLSAYHKGAEIVIEISDDGKGLDRDRILVKAKERGLIEEGAELSDSEVFALIFEPGFSTAAQVTDLSGRGVGMDVVRRNLAKLRGTIDIESKPGIGSTFYLRLPLTLAIIEGLVVIVGDQRFIVPVFAVKEMVRLTSDMISTFRGKREMALIRGELLPIIRLSTKLGISTKLRTLTDGLVIISEADGKQFGIWIEDLIGSQEVVIKSLGDGFKDIRGVSGCAILGDGRVGLILDLPSICRGENQC